MEVLSRFHAEVLQILHPSYAVHSLDVLFLSNRNGPSSNYVLILRFQMAKCNARIQMMHGGMFSG